MKLCSLWRMAERGRPKVALVLSDVEHQTLLSWSRRAKTAQAVALRGRIVLGCAEGTNNKEVAAALGNLAADGVQVASEVRPGPAGGPGRRAASGRRPEDH